jgi:hypothetical protein
MVATAFQTSHSQFALIRIGVRNTHRQGMPRRLFRLGLRMQTDAEDRPANQNRSPHVLYGKAKRRSPRVDRAASKINRGRDS